MSLCAAVYTQCPGIGGPVSVWDTVDLSVHTGGHPGHGGDKPVRSGHVYTHTIKVIVASLLF